jgi:hypothetical protein
MRRTAKAFPHARTLVLAAAIAGAGCGFFALRVFVGFAPLRVKALQTPIRATENRVEVIVSDDKVNALGRPFALIARVRNDTAPQDLELRLDGTSVCSTTLGGGRSARIDCAVVDEWTVQPTHTVSIAGRAPWTLEYLELATHHGNSTGVVTAFVLPRGSHHYRRPSVLHLTLLWAILAVLFLLEPYAFRSRPARSASTALIAIVVLLFAILLLLPAFQPYLVVISPATFAALILLATLSRTWPIVVRLRPQVARGAATILSDSRRAAVSAVAAVDAAMRRTWTSGGRHPGWLVWILAVLISAATVAHAARAVGGADEYGYVSQAELWLEGSLKIEQPFVKQLPWRSAGWSFAPLGYRPHPDDASVIVPVYSPGLPMLLAVAKLIGGQEAMFWVVPLSAGLLVLATFGIGRRLGDDAIGVIGAWLVATSPVVLFMAVAMMTDVPVAAVWASAVYCLLGTTARSAAAAGLLSGLAVLIRPNLAPLAGILGLYFLLAMRHADGRRRALGHMLVFSAALVPGVAAVALINASLYGSPFTSGYGKLSELFAWSRVLTNLTLYLQWFVEAHTPVALLGFVAILIPSRRLWPAVRDRSIFIVIAAFVIAVWGIYCAWLVFDAWWFARFLLSSWPFIMLGVGAFAVAAYRAGGRLARSLLVAAVVAVGLFQFDFAVKQGTFQARDGRRRFVAVARLVHRVTDENSVIISLDHSGSIRYYGGRMTMNYAWIPNHSLDPIVEWLSARGVRTYVAAEGNELDEIRQRFAGNACLRILDESPLAIYEHPGRMLLFDLTKSGPPGRDTFIERDVPVDETAPPVSPPRIVLKEKS